MSENRIDYETGAQPKTAKEQYPSEQDEVNMFEDGGKEMDGRSVITAEGNDLPQETNEEKLRRLAGEINAIKEQTREVIQNATLAIGERLIQAKAAVPHGGWRHWLETYVDYSERTAQMLMSTYERFGSGQQKLIGKAMDAELVAQLNRSQMFALMSIKDEDACIEFMEEHREELPDMSKRELEQAIRERDEARRAAEKSEEAAHNAWKERDRAAEHMEELQKELEAVQIHCEEKLKILQERYDELQKKAKAEKRMEQEYKELEEGLRQKLKERQDQYDEQAAELRALKASMESGNAKENERISELEEQNCASIARIRELEQELEQAKAEQMVSPVPEETQKELEELRQKVSQEKQREEAGQRFAVIFKMVQDAFNDLLGIAAKMEAEPKEKYKSACRSMAQAMEKAVDDI